MNKRRFPYDLEEVHEAITALSKFSKHLNTVGIFLTYRTLGHRPGDWEVSKLFWPDEVQDELHPCSNIEIEVKRAFWHMATTLSSALNGFHLFYFGIIENDRNVAKEQAKLQPDSEKWKRIQEHREWLAKIAEWTADILAKHYASIAQEDAAWKQETKTGVPASQSSSSLCNYLSGRCAPATSNPFPALWEKYRNDGSLRSVSKHREFIKDTIPHGTAAEIIANVAKSTGCNFDRSIHRHFLSEQQFKDAWPHLSKYIAAKIRDYNSLAKLNSKTYRKSKRWAPEFEEYMSLEGSKFEDWQRHLIGGAKWVAFRGQEVDWSEIETSCKRHAKAMLCGTKADKPEWRRGGWDLLPSKSDSKLFIESIP